MSSQREIAAIEAGSDVAADSTSRSTDAGIEQAMASVTEIVLAGGVSVRVPGDPREVEAAILAADRGSIMEFAWMTEAESGCRVGVNPNHVLMLRAIDPDLDE